jgi:hypothetical protein
MRSWKGVTNTSDGEPQPSVHSQTQIVDSLHRAGGLLDACLSKLHMALVQWREAWAFADIAHSH